MSTARSVNSALPVVPEYSDARTAAFRATLDRLPDEIALAIGLHVYSADALNHFETCVCGWVLREAIARETARASEDVRSAESRDSTDYALAKRFGGTPSDWDDIYCGVCDADDAPLIEEALFDRAMAAALKAGGSSKGKMGGAK